MISRPRAKACPPDPAYRKFGEITVTPQWFKQRRYRHFDEPVTTTFVNKITCPMIVARHDYFPLIKYDMTEKRYKLNPDVGKGHIENKVRPICYASHRDACIYTYYAHLLNSCLETRYRRDKTGECSLAYRKGIGANYIFAADAYRFACENSPVTILALDVKGFFDNLDHGILKSRLKSVLNVERLSKDWYAIFKQLTKYHFVKRKHLEDCPHLKSRFELDHRGKPPHGRIASIAEIKKYGIPIQINPNITKGIMSGIPQGTPISAVLSNVYMVEFDYRAMSFCSDFGAYYRRYSDDILVICKPEHAEHIHKTMIGFVSDERLEINSDKTEVTPFGHSLHCLEKRHRRNVAQYLGFKLDPNGPYLREATLARQWRKALRAMRRTSAISTKRIREGKSNKILVQKLYKKHQYIRVSKGGAIYPVRNFPSYVRARAAAFGGGKKMLRQAKRLEKRVSAEMKKFKVVGKNEVRKREDRLKRIAEDNR